MSRKRKSAEFSTMYKPINGKFIVTCLYLYSIACVAGCSVERYVVSNTTLSKKDFDIYILIGQSNMTGRAPILQPQRDTLKNVYLFTGNGWEPAANPLDKYSSVKMPTSKPKLGLGYSFAKELESCTGRKIGLVVNARGGTRIEWWEKGFAGKNDFDLYEQAVLQARKAMKYGKLKGIIWHQGEGNQSNADSYIPLLKQLVNDLRKDLRVKDAFFVAGELGKWRKSSLKINQVIRTVSSEIKNADYVSSDGLTPLNGDRTNAHFDTRSQLILGERYAGKVLKNVYKLDPCKK